MLNQDLYVCNPPFLRFNADRDYYSGLTGPARLRELPIILLSVFLPLESFMAPSASTVRQLQELDKSLTLVYGQLAEATSLLNKYYTLLLAEEARARRQGRGGESQKDRMARLELDRCFLEVRQ